MINKLKTILGNKSVTNQRENGAIFYANNKKFLINIIHNIDIILEERKINIVNILDNNYDDYIKFIRYNGKKYIDKLGYYTDENNTNIIIEILEEIYNDKQLLKVVDVLYKLEKAKEQVKDLTKEKNKLYTTEYKCLYNSTT